ncbi:carbonic anhydrase [Desulfosporosinus orientis DSM 765]|uniref:Carbonic anhydrase n=1 Tax=Desulfosporosinus orientis (strain ATCC 19365 / DSM 765 / NCIMB 8382 / VKM B-1628 / Singapore I) TaxID=768706 RepID=G7WF55_DESOD|nr:carbonic anhydrase [Desulfosporosinus orientis]AET67666.1 carbonic anhydrase [Desulfosporosinus orientis DSM 765]
MRKLFIYLSCILLGLVLLANLQFGEKDNLPAQEVLTSSPVYERTEVISSPNEAKQLLSDGNERYTTGKTLKKDISINKRSELLEKGQHPFAVIVSCSDSRVPPEILFDQALGDLFVIRVAGNVITPVELGSVEYAVEHLGTPLVVVLGHEACGAVTAALQAEGGHGNIGEIIKIIKPAVDKAKGMGLNDKDVLDKSIDLNVKNTREDILESPIIQERVKSNRLQIIGMKYDLDQGNLQYID